MFSIEVQTHFLAAHALRLPDGTLEASHQHDFQVTVRIAARELDSMSTVMDFHQVEEFLNAIVDPWRGRDLNQIKPFSVSTNPSAEQIAQLIGYELNTALKGLALRGMIERPSERALRLAEVRLTEAPHCLALWTPD